MPDVFPHFCLISFGTNTKSKYKKFVMRDATSDSDWWGKLPHLALWQQAMALSGLTDYADTQAILMTPSIYPSPLSFLSLSQPLALVLHPPTVKISRADFCH